MRKMKLVFAVLLAVSAIGLVIIGYGCMSTVQESVSTTTVSTTTTTLYAKSWGTPRRISEGAGSAADPDLVMDDSGNINVVWNQKDGTGVSSIYADRYVAGSGWGNPEVIENGSGVALFPRIAVDGSGNAIVVWQQDDGTGINSIYENRYIAGSGWGTAGLIEGGSGEVGFPRIAMDSSGNATVVWEQDDGTGVTSIYANRYIAGSGWGTATSIESDDIDAVEPKIAVDGSGNAVAVWVEFDGTKESFHANRYAAGSGWGAATDIGIVTGEANLWFQVAIDTSGNAMAVWSQSDGTVHNIYANLYVPGTGWETAKTLENEPGAAYSPDIGTDGLGNAIAVWTQSDGMRNNVLAKRYVYGHWEAGKTNLSGLDECYLPRIAVNENGDAVAVWIIYPTIDLWSSRYTSGSWEASKGITGGVLFSYGQEVAINNNGDAVVVWSHGEAVEQGEIWANMYR